MANSNPFAYLFKWDKKSQDVVRVAALTGIVGIVVSVTLFGISLLLHPLENAVKTGRLQPGRAEALEELL